MQTLRIRRDRLADLQRDHDLSTHKALAEAMRIDAATVSRVLATPPKAAPGPVFIAAALRAFGVRFEDLFETVGDDVPRAEVSA